MQTEQMKTQQLQLLAKKALLRDEIDAIDRSLGQLGILIQFAEANTPKTEPDAAPE